MPVDSEIEDGDGVVFKLRFEGPGGNAAVAPHMHLQRKFDGCIWSGRDRSNESFYLALGAACLPLEDRKNSG